MDVFSISKSSTSLCSVPFLSRYSTFPAEISRKPARRLMDLSVTFIKCPSWAPSTSRRAAKLPVYSMFRRPPRRRNSLREKHIHKRDQVTLLPELSNSEYNFEKLCLREHESKGNVLGINLDSVKESAVVEDSNKFDSRNSVLWDRLENWVDRLKEDSEFWGIGTGPIFTIFQDSDGNINRVSVNEDEIQKRNRIQVLSLNDNEESGDFKDVTSKISRARVIAKEIETGAYSMPRNSSIAKFVVDGKKSSLVGLLHALSSKREILIRIFPGIGLVALCCFFVLSISRKLLAEYNNVELTREEGEMLRRKKKSRMEKGNLQKGSVEVLQNDEELAVVSGKLPQLDRNELMKSIEQAKKSKDTLVLSDPSDQFTDNNLDFDRKVREIRDMVRKVHEVEHQKKSSDSHTEEHDDLASIKVDTGNHEKSAKETNTVDAVNILAEEQETNILENSQTMLVEINMSNSGAQNAVSLSDETDVKREKVYNNSTNKSLSVSSSNKRRKPKIITSLKEANEYLSTKKGRIPTSSVQPEQPIYTKRASEVHSTYPSRSNGNLDRISDMGKVTGLDPGISDIKLYENDEEDDNFSVNTDVVTKMNLAFQSGEPDERQAEVINFDRPADLDDVLMGNNDDIELDGLSSGTEIQHPVRDCVSGCIEPGNGNTSFSLKSLDAMEDISSKESVFSNSSHSEGQNENLNKTNRKSWVEDNFQKFDSVIEKIGTGFKDNYMLAKVKAQENSLSSAEIGKLCLWGEDDELEWMKDENLLEIVFQVRENELAGRDPFYLMDADDQQAFFLGLEHKAEKVNEKLAVMHEWIHSKIENLDYGTDGISLDDPLEKIIPRWKGPPIDKDPEFLKKFINTGTSDLVENMRNLDYIAGGKHESFKKSESIPNPDGSSPYSPINDRIKLSERGSSAPPKILIECSDGSSRYGKKNLKEQWQHTKKWSRGFLEVYNTETDPEVKSILKDMGKDLDRWITPKEIKGVADLMTQIPKKKRRVIEKKMNKIKSEVEKYGAHAVVSKYKEYAGEREEDYLWWLDLPFVLCIEVYSVEDDVPRIGFYSLEMAEDLELNPKQYHVIAFEDAGDSKNFCHILQAQMDIQGNGKAFVVARPPKDAFREAKANGFSLTMIRKGEIKLNVDQTLEEVEEELKELGSKIYHDKLMNERGVNIHSLMKGVITANKSSNRMIQS